MKSGKTVLLIAIVLIAVIIGAGMLYRSLASERPATTPEAATGSPTATPSASSSATAQPEDETLPEAPDFTMLNSDGEQVALSDYLGTPLVLNFWASWCGPCKSEMPVFDSVAAELAGRVNFLMVNLTDGSRETVESARRFIEEQGYDFPVFFDTLFEGASAYAVRSIPVTYFIDGAGRVQGYSAGSMDEETLRRGIDLID